MSEWRQRWRRWLKPPRRLKTTGMGRVYIALTVGVGIAALNTGNNLLYLVLGFLLAIIVVSGVLSERALRSLSVRRRLPDGCFAEEPFALRYELTVGLGRSFALQLTERDGTLAGSGWCPLCEAGTPQVIRADVTAKRRGPLRLTGVDITTSFPLGLFEKTIPLDLDDLLLVYPKRSFSCELPQTHANPKQGDTGSPRHKDGTNDLVGLRELNESDDARRIHWVKSAAAGKLLVAERERDDRRQVVLTANDLGSREDIDQQCETLAATVHALLERGFEVGLTAPGRRLRPASGLAHQRRVLQALAWLGFDDQRKVAP